MRMIKPSFEILSDTQAVIDQMLIIELAGRNCYKSEDKICEGSADKMIGMLRMKKHLSVLEHGNITVRMIGSRAMSHQLVRHRLASYSQESQRYVNYSKEKHGKGIVFIEPIGYDSWEQSLQEKFFNALESSEIEYMDLIRRGMKAEDARGVLPNQTKTEVVVTMNVRSWMYFFTMRCDKHAQAEIRFIAKGLLVELHKLMPVIFEELYKEYICSE